jgi:hypothetical protein
MLKEKPFPFQVSQSGEKVNKQFSLDKNVIRVVGLTISSEYPELLFYRGTQRIEINGEELFEQEHESKMLMRGLEEKKYTELGEGVFAGNGEVKINYQDTPNSNAPFIPYRVTLYLLLELR